VDEALAARGAARAPCGNSVAASPDLDVRGLSKRFPGGRGSVLHDVALAVRPGESVALLGHNGAGKSTLLRCCLRLIEPDEGHVRLLGRDLRALRGRALREARRSTGFVFQRHNLVGRLSALSNVVHGALGTGFPLRRFHQALAPRALRDRALECLRSVGLSHLAGQRADRLSGGESQRVAIARALVGRPRLVFADEPVASLDPGVGEEVMGLFSGLIRRERLTLLFTSHQLDHALAYADRVVALRAGRVVLDAPARDVSRAELRGLYA
jgi:phosphonate transport system ATP-binding protein